jgi:N-acetylglucosamine-6-sulfatase
VDPAFPLGSPDPSKSPTLISPPLSSKQQLTPGRTLDGRSLLPLSHDPELADRRPILLEGQAGGRYGLSHYAGIRSGRYLYADYQYRDGGGDAELYDLAEDPYQRTNRAQDPSYADIREELADKLAALQACLGGSCR